MFIDKVNIKIESGYGGNGVVAWRREKYVDKGGPAGGDGGKGASVFICGDESISTLMDFKYKSVFKAQNGENGRGKNQHGKCGQDLIINVPLGTVIKDVENSIVIADIKEHDQCILVAKGGRGGRGNARFANSVNRAPSFCEPGESGINRELELELKLIADVGLLGLPNAGKSTFISVVSQAKPKIASYPFTTIVPNLGVVKKHNGDAFVIADIPGLIPGASRGVGLGFEFLRHIERCRFLVHIVDISDENCVENYHKINQELKNYNEDLANLYQIIALNKSDIVDSEYANNILNKFKELRDDVFLISAFTKNNIQPLINFISQKTDEIEKHDIKIDTNYDYIAENNDDSSFYVQKINKSEYFADGGKIRRLISVTDDRDFEQINRLYNILDAMGVFNELKKLGLTHGDVVILGSKQMFDKDFLKSFQKKNNINSINTNIQNICVKKNSSMIFTYFKD